MPAFLNLLPLPITNTVFTIKTHLSDQCANSLIAVDIIEPQCRHCKKQQQQNTCCLYAGTLEYFKFNIADFHLLNPRKPAGRFGT